MVSWNSNNIVAIAVQESSWRSLLEELELSANVDIQQQYIRIRDQYFVLEDEN